MAESANQSAPNILQDDLLMEQSLEEAELPTVNTTIDLGAYANRRGRKPKAYYEQLKAIKQEAINSIDQKVLLNTSALSDEPPVKKKRGRKPKSYYWNLQIQQQQQQLQQSANNQNEDLQPDNTDNMSSHDHLASEGEASGGFMQIKAESQSSMKPNIVRKIMESQQKLYRPVSYQKSGIWHLCTNAAILPGNRFAHVWFATEEETRTQTEELSATSARTNAWIEQQWVDLYGISTKR